MPGRIQLVGLSAWRAVFEATFLRLTAVNPAYPTGKIFLVKYVLAFSTKTTKHDSFTILKKTKTHINLRILYILRLKARLLDKTASQTNKLIAVVFLRFAFFRNFLKI
jgi:hypothetical protein